MNDAVPDAIPVAEYLRHNAPPWEGRPDGADPDAMPAAGPSLLERAAVACLATLVHDTPSCLEEDAQEAAYRQAARHALGFGRALVEQVATLERRQARLSEAELAQMRALMARA